MKYNNIQEKKSLHRRQMLQILGTGGMLGLLGFTGRNRNFVMTGTTGKSINKNSSAMKTMGILGGIGPQATINFETEIHLASQRLIAPLYNSGYPPMVVYYHRHAPVLLTPELTPVLPLQPDPGLLDAAKKLGTMADFILIASNGVHAMQKEIEQAAGRPVLSMIDATLEEVKKRQWRKVGVMGYKNAMVYTSRLKEMGIQFETINDKQQAALDTIVMKVMEGRDDDKDNASILEMVHELRKRGVDGIIPGCTELPLLLTEAINDADMLNPARLLAEAAVRYSLA